MSIWKNIRNHLSISKKNITFFHKIIKKEYMDFIKSPTK